MNVVMLVFCGVMWFNMQMITTAIKQLKEVGGSSEEAISECIMNDNSDLPWAHAALVRHHLGKLCEKGDIVQTREGLYVLNDPIASVSHVSSPSNPSEFFDATDSPSCSLSINLSSDSSSDSLYGERTSASSKRKRKRGRKSKKVRNKRKGRTIKGSVRRKNIHLKRRRKVRGRLPKKGKRKEEISSDEEKEVELHDIVLQERTDAIKAENQLKGQKVMVEVEEESHPLEDINQDGRQQEMQEMTNSSPGEEDRLEDSTQMNAEIDVIEVQDVVVKEKMEVDGGQNQIGEQDVMQEVLKVRCLLEKTEQEDKQQEMQEKSRSWPCEKDSGKISTPMNEERDAQNLVVEARTDDIEAQNEQKEQEMMKGRNPLRLEHNDSHLEMDGKNDTVKENIQMNAEMKAMELQDLEVQEGTVVIEEQNQLKQLEVMEEEHQDNLQEVQGEKNTWKENLLCVENQLQEQKLMEELHPLEEDNQQEMLEVSPSIPCEDDTRQEIIQMNEDIEVIEVLDSDVEEQIIGNQAHKEQEVMEEWHQSLKMEKEDKQEDTKEKKRDWAFAKGILSQEREVQDLLLQKISEVDEGQHQLMQLDVMEKEEYLLQLIETNDQLEKTNLVNDTKLQEKVDEDQKEQQVNNEHGCQKWRGTEIIHSPKSSSFLDKEQGMQQNKDFQLVNVQQSMQTIAEIVQDQSTKEINVLENTNEPEEGRCFRSKKMIKSGQKHEAVQTSIGSEVAAHEETINIKLNDQQEQETVAFEVQSHEKAQIDMVVDPDIVCSSDEVEEISSPFLQNNGVSSEEEQQELQYLEDTKQEQLSQRQLRPRLPKTEPGKATNVL